MLHPSQDRSQVLNLNLPITTQDQDQRVPHGHLTVPWPRFAETDNLQAGHVLDPSSDVGRGRAAVIGLDEVAWEHILGLWVQQPRLAIQVPEEA